MYERKYSIAVGNSCEAKFWANEEVTFDELCQRLSNTKYTSETVEQYKHFNKEERNKAKDNGGFVGGKLKGTKRGVSEVLFRSMLTLDLDKAKLGFIDKFTAESKYLSCLYTTHSHTKEEPRCRVIVPLSRDVTPDEYNAIARLFASQFGIEQFDACSFRIAQLMFYPTTPKNGEFIFKKIEGKVLNPDKFLADYPMWHDISTLPLTPDELPKNNVQRGRKKKDPTELKGVIGAFCRAYTVQEAIETYLSDVYEPTDKNNRYSLKSADSKGGLIIYDDKYAFSHHATDIACGRELNAFQLVMLHLFGSDNNDAVKKMKEVARDDERVRTQLILDNGEFDEDEINDDGQSKSPIVSKAKPIKDWISKLSIGIDGAIENTSKNLEIILENDKNLQGFAYNELSNRVEVIGRVPWDRPKANRFWREADESQLRLYIDKKYIEFKERNFEVAFNSIVDNRRFHPVRDYLDSLPKWDGVKRVEEVFIKFLSADDNDYTRAITKKTFAACVARAYHPGTKFDSIPVLDGAQGIGKSTLIKYLAGEEFFSDNLSLTDMNDKTAAEKIQGNWLIEIGELSGMKKADIEKVKSFVSTTDDKYRASYGRVVESHPRQCVIFATVNGDGRGYLRDITGNRRFWIVKCNQTLQKRMWDENDKNYRDQFWSEAKEIYESGEELYLEGSLLDIATDYQNEALEQDERVGIVEQYLNRLLPKNWHEMDLYKRRSFLNGDDFICEKGTIQRTEVSNAEIWCECFGKSQSDLKSSDSYQLAAIMKQIGGWERTSTIRNLPIYGRQRIYKKRLNANTKHSKHN
jgi:predicted P-loop ATPase